MLAPETTGGRRRTILLWACGVVALGSLMCVEQVPPHFPVPTPAGISAYHCHPTDLPAKPVLATPVPFEATLKAWPTKTGTFVQGRPIEVAQVRSQDVTLTLSDGQRKLLSKSEADRAASLVPIGGDF